MVNGGADTISWSAEVLVLSAAEATGYKDITPRDSAACSTQCRLFARFCCCFSCNTFWFSSCHQFHLRSYISSCSLIQRQATFYIYFTTYDCVSKAISSSLLSISYTVFSFAHSFTSRFTICHNENHPNHRRSGFSSCYLGRSRAQPRS